MERICRHIDGTPNGSLYACGPIPPECYFRPKALLNPVSADKYGDTGIPLYLLFFRYGAAQAYTGFLKENYLEAEAKWLARRLGPYSFLAKMVSCYVSWFQSEFQVEKLGVLANILKEEDNQSPSRFDVDLELFQQKCSRRALWVETVAVVREYVKTLTSAALGLDVNETELESIVDSEFGDSVDLWRFHLSCINEERWEECLGSPLEDWGFVHDFFELRHLARGGFGQEFWTKICDDYVLEGWLGSSFQGQAERIVDLSKCFENDALRDMLVQKFAMTADSFHRNVFIRMDSDERHCRVPDFAQVFEDFQNLDKYLYPLKSWNFQLYSTIPTIPLTEKQQEMLRKTEGPTRDFLRIRRVWTDEKERFKAAAAMALAWTEISLHDE